MSRTHADICAYCGSPSPTTRDHIPPKGVFPSPRPDDLITVPSCAACNQGASGTDEFFRTFLSLRVGVDTAPTSRLWRQALEGIKITSKNFGLETELTIKLLKKGCRILEVPIHYKARTRAEGKKINWRTALQLYFGVFKYRFSRE